MAVTKDETMKRIFKSLTLSILISLFISCSGQVKKEKISQKNEETQAARKIPVPKNGFSNAFVDKDGSLWFSSNGGGIYHYNGITFNNYTKNNVLSSNQVFSIASDQNDNLWFGTQNGLTKYNRKQFEHIRLPYQDTTTIWLDKVYPVINPNAVYSLATDNNDLWIGTTGGGAYKYDGKHFKSYLTEIGRKQEDSLYHNWVSYIKKDNKGNMWFASMTNGGVSKFDGKIFTHYSVKEGLADNMVRIIYQDSKGAYWYGFNGNRNSALTKFDGTLFKTYSIEDGLCHQQIRAIGEDKNGKLWIGSDHGNLCIFDGQKFSEFNYNGQTFSSVFFIFKDLDDNIWFGGRNGIWNYDGQTLTEITTNE